MDLGFSRGGGGRFLKKFINFFVGRSNWFSKLSENTEKDSVLAKLSAPQAKFWKNSPKLKLEHNFTKMLINKIWTCFCMLLFLEIRLKIKRVFLNTENFVFHFLKSNQNHFSSHWNLNWKRVNRKSTRTYSKLSAAFLFNFSSRFFSEERFILRHLTNMFCLIEYKKSSAVLSRKQEGIWNLVHGRI